jgi:nucleotide-binding universal stress UspA family protein
VKLLEEQINTAISLKNILFATDFSDVSEAALPYVTAMSLRYGGTVHVAHVLPEINFVRPSPIDPVSIGSIYEDAHSGAQEQMQQLSLTIKGFPHRTYVRRGKVSEVLSEIIREQEIDLLVVGTHGGTGVGKLLLGSVAEEIFRQATCPVFTVVQGFRSSPDHRRVAVTVSLPPPRSNSGKFYTRLISRPTRLPLRHMHFRWHGNSGRD